MLQMNGRNLSLSPKYHPLQQARCTKTLQSPATRIHGFLNRNQGKEYSIKCSQNSSSFNLTNKIRNNKYSVPATLQKDCASRNEDDDNNSPSFQDVLQKKLNAVYRFARPYTQIGTIVGIASISLLPLQSFADLTPKYFVGSLMALVSAMLMNTYGGTLNQLTDVEIDKVNKPHLPIASGDLSMGTGIALTLICALLSLAIAIKLQSPPLVFGLIVWFLLGTAYSIDLPFLRWKANPFLAAMCMMIAFGLVYQFPFFMHVQKYVLGRPVVITRPLIFTTAIICCFAVVMALVKDIPDEEGDREFGIRTLCVRIGKERVFWLGVYMLSIAYGAGVIVGASSSSLLGKIVSIIGHSTAAVLLWLRTRTVDLSNSASTYSFYMFIWELFYAEYFLIHFLR